MLIIGSIHSVRQMLLAPIAPTLAMVAVFVLSRLSWHRKDTEVAESTVMKPCELDDEEDSQQRAEEAVGHEEKEMSLFMALSPYLALIDLDTEMA